MNFNGIMNRNAIFVSFQFISVPVYMSKCPLHHTQVWYSHNIIPMCQRRQTGIHSPPYLFWRWSYSTYLRFSLYSSILGLRSNVLNEQYRMSPFIWGYFHMCLFYHIQLKHYVSSPPIWRSHKYLDKFSYNVLNLPHLECVSIMKW